MASLRPLELSLIMTVSVLPACTRDARVGGSAGSGATSVGETEGADGGDNDTDEGGIFDVPEGDDGPGQVCRLPEGADSAPGQCEESAPPDAFEARLEWSWPGANGETYAVATPLVANLTDDNGDGFVDLCDTPDVVVVAFDPAVLEQTEENLDNLFNGPGHLYILDGATGEQRLRIPDRVWWWATPALGDIDGDGVPEIIAATTVLGNVMAWNHDGTPVSGWDSSFVIIEDLPEIVYPTTGDQFQTRMASPPVIADLDHDGTPEILIHRWIFDNKGSRIATLEIPNGTPNEGSVRSTLVADLDDDGRVEIIFGTHAFTWVGDGTLEPYFYNSEIGSVSDLAIADFNDDGHPEILYSALLPGSSPGGLALLDHQGETLMPTTRPDPLHGLASFGAGPSPIAIHDFSGDGRPEFAYGAENVYVIGEIDFSATPPAPRLTRQWPVLDESGFATGTAFDFLGDGSAEAMYADGNRLYVFDSSNDQAAPLVEEPRTSRTLMEYPVVADVDNDGSAEIIVVSNENISSVSEAPTVQVYGDVEDRWIQAQRIWNQHAYTVTNVREDGTIPANPTPSWKAFNTFRTNAQIEQGGVACIPPAG